MKKLVALRGHSQLKRAALNILVKTLKPKYVENLKEEFMKIDTDSSGFIETAELKRVLEKMHPDVS